MPKSTDLLVVNPSLSYFAFAQRVSPAAYARAKVDLGEFFEEIQFVPYTQALHRKLKSQYKQYYSQINYVPQY